jgi:hypothetical protein
VVAGVEQWWWELNGGSGRGWREKNLGERVKRENENENHGGRLLFLSFLYFFF